MSAAQPDRVTDLEWILALGVPIDDVADRIGRTPSAVAAEIDAVRRSREDPSL